jgi:hypothetical protein
LAKFFLFVFCILHSPSPSFFFIFKKVVSLHFNLKSLMVWKRHPI